MAASQRSALQFQRTPSSSTQVSSTSSNEMFTFFGTPPTSIETSPDLGSLMPTRLNKQPTHITSGPAQEPSNTTNSNTRSANTVPGPTIKQSKGKAKTALSKEESDDRHKRNEAIRRNREAVGWTKLKARIPEEYKIPGKKANNKTESLKAAVKWLHDLKTGNDELENTYKALLEAHKLISDGYLAAEKQVQEQQQQQQQQLQLPTPPSGSPANQQPTPEADALLTDHMDLNDASQVELPQSLQPTTPPPQPNQGNGVILSQADADNMFDVNMRALKYKT